ncbi:hypothetical protein GQ600_13158 [Phytophthora cactorum]|nr:hypothetical protein GQ600_13158 [Phytophthora cactorum]
MLADGSLDEEKKKICKSDPQDENFQFTNFGEPPLIGVYFVYLVCFALLAYWNVHRRMIYRRNCTVTDDTSSRGITDLLSRTKYELISADNSERLVQTGYSCSSIGQIVFVYFVMATVLLHILLIIVICDYYDCFTPHLFDPLSASATVFFLVWLFAALWLIAIVVYQRDLPNFFRVPSALNNCEFVHMLKSDDTEIMLTDRTGYFRKLRGFQETVRVEVIGGQRIVDFQHLRYVYNEELRQFIPTEISIGRTYADIGAAGNSGLTTIEAQKRLQTIGLNVVDIMCYYVWYYFTYWDMGIVMTLVVLGTAIINIYTKRKMQAAIVKMTRYRTEVSVFVIISGKNSNLPN